MKRENVVTMAQASWALPLLAMGINVVSSSQPRDIRSAMAVVGMVIYLLALVLGVVALAYVPKFGREKIFTNALVGTILSAGLIALVVVFVMVMLPRLHP
jgi:hypothetical protein